MGIITAVLDNGAVSSSFVDVLPIENLSTLLMSVINPITDVRGMCERLLVNPVMEDFDIEIVE